MYVYYIYMNNVEEEERQIEGKGLEFPIDII